MKAKAELLPEIEKRFKDRICVEYRDISDIENYKLLLSLAKKHDVKDAKNVVPVFYLEGHFLSRTKLSKETIERFIIKSLSHEAAARGPSPDVNLTERFKAFEPLVIISAGLIDGVNPCAFTVMVFFISFLTLQGYRRRELVIIGLSFILAVFLTYILVGVGLFGFLYRLRHFWLATKIFNMLVGGLSVALGFFAVYDFLRFKKTKTTDGMLLQLPAAIKNRIHSVIGLHYRKTKNKSDGQSLSAPLFSLSLSALVTGFLVSLLEAVCTGQTYLPTITFVLKTTSLKLEALLYLLLYNFMFIVPLSAIFLFALWGVGSEEFTRVLRKHLLSIKILMALLFFGLGIFLIWRA
jgi:cytochrome c biogenesis protein CcdA